MEYKLCSYVRYVGHAPLFTQSVERVRYGWSKANGFVCHVPNPKHMLYLVSRVVKLVPVVPVADGGALIGKPLKGTPLTGKPKGRHYGKK